MFKNREQAGFLLAQKLAVELSQKEKEKAVILALPRGGVVVAFAVAKILKCPLDIVIVRKLGVPGNSELAMGAIAKGEASLYLNQKIIEDLKISPDYLEQEKRKQQLEIERREAFYRQGKKSLDLRQKNVILIDDGAATGATLIAACRQVWPQKPKKLIIALPVAPKETVKLLEQEADEVLVLEQPAVFFAVSEFYQEFNQVTDEEVKKILSS